MQPTVIIGSGSAGSTPAILKETNPKETVGHFLLTDGKTVLKDRDEVVILPHGKHLSEVAERWSASSS